jgi:hypothetical protein
MKYIKFILILINILIYLFVKYSKTDIFIINLIQLNILAYVFFDFINFRITNFKNENKSLKSEIFKIINFKTSSFIDYLIIIFPLVFLFFNNTIEVYGVNYIFVFVLLIFLFIAVTSLNVLIFKYFNSKYYIYIISIGIIFQFFNIYNDFSLNKFYVINCAYILLLNCAFLILYQKLKKSSYNIVKS